MRTLLPAELLGASLAPHALFRCADDADETRQRVGAVFRPHQMGVMGQAQRLAARMDHLRLAGLSLNRLSYGASVSIASEPMDSFVMVFIPLSGVIDIRCGHQQVAASPRQPAVVSATQPLRMQWRADADVFILRLEAETLQQACAQQLGHALDGPIEFDLAMNPEHAGFNHWRALLHFLCTSPGFAEHSASQPLVAAQLERLLASSLLLAQRHSYSDALARPRRDEAPAFIRRAEHLMARRSDEPLTLPELARQLGVSVRTLQAGFRRWREASPLAVMRGIRLDQVHADLRQAARQGLPLSVAEAALAHGFTHLGHFSRAYFERFGVLPSATLRRPDLDGH